MANIEYLRLSGVTYNLVDSTAIHSLDGYYTSQETQNAITAATNALAESIAEQHYQTSGDVESAITAVTTPINNTLTAHTANTDIHVTIADKTAWDAKLDNEDIESLFGYSEYDSSTHRINFKHSSTGTVLSYIDASPFIVDGMVSNVEIKAVSGVTSLVVSFNTDAGHQDIVIPISQIFDASNYYTKTEVDDAISSYTYDKATIDQKISDSGTFDPTQYYNKTATDALLADKADTATTYTKTEVDTALNDKQDTLVSGTNIKTINGASILGNGDITVQTLPTVQGTTLVFS